MKLIIEDDEGRRTVVPFARPEITLGRDEGNTIRLTERNVSRKHARFVRVNGHVEIEDLGSSNGIKVNGERIEKRAKVTERDLIQIGDYDLALEEDGVPLFAASPPPTAAAPPPLPLAETMPPLVPLDDALHGDAEDTTVDPAPAPLPDSLDPSNPRRQPTSVIKLDELEASRLRPVTEIPIYEAPQLVVLNTSHAGKSFTCLRTEMKIGRTDENDIAIDHRSLSRTHAKLVFEHNEWRVIDMQSANGVLINGEGYAQASLHYGDLLELGHVKLRFEGPGGVSHAAIPSFRGRRGLIALVLGAGVVALGAVLILRMGGSAPPETRVPEAASTSALPEAPDPKTPPPPEAVATPAPAFTPSPAVPTVKTVTVKPVVVSAPQPKPKPPREAVAAPRAAPSPPPSQVQENSARDLAERLYNEGKASHKKQQLREAELSFKRCLVADPTYARCHMMLGSTYALMKEFERGAQHYRRFVEMSPDDPHAEQVRVLLQKYDESVGPGKPAQR